MLRKPLSAAYWRGFWHAIAIACIAYDVQLILFAWSD
jgi:hypothetical protein